MKHQQCRFYLLLVTSIFHGDLARRELGELEAEHNRTLASSAAITHSHKHSKDRSHSKNIHTFTQAGTSHKDEHKSVPKKGEQSNEQLLASKDERRAEEMRMQVGKAHETPKVLPVNANASSMFQANLNNLMVQRKYEKELKEKLHKTCTCKEGSETSTNVCFTRVSNSFEKKYSSYGRMLQLPKGKLSLDFELETDAGMELTPEILLARGGFNVTSLIVPRPSKWFSIEFDGLGHRFNKTDYHQQVQSVMELESVPMKVEDVQNSSFLDELQQFLSVVSSKKNKTRVPGSNNLFFKRVNYPNDTIMPLLQYTVGLPLAWVPSLLSKANSKDWQSVVHRLSNLKHCNSENETGTSCTPEYKGLVSLAAGALQQLKKCMPTSGCTNPKRCMKPWLVRTHFGDLLNHVRQSVENSTLDQFPEHVLQVADVKPDDLIFPNGMMDYLKFPELAEVGGIVVPRSSLLTMSQDINASRLSKLKCMPTTYEDLHWLAKSMLEQKTRVNQLLKERSCGVHGLKDQNLTRFSARTWLQEMVRGRDIMSDWDSLITQKSFSKLVWKSMGSWRMSPHSNGRVYLECRDARRCFKLRNETSKWARTNFEAISQIRQVADSMQALEHAMAATLV